MGNSVGFEPGTTDSVNDCRTTELLKDFTCCLFCMPIWIDEYRREYTRFWDLHVGTKPCHFRRQKGSILRPGQHVFAGSIALFRMRRNLHTRLSFQFPGTYFKRLGGSPSCTQEQGRSKFGLGHSDSHYIGRLLNFADSGPLPQIPQEFMRQGPRTKTSRGGGIQRAGRER